MPLVEIPEIGTVEFPDEMSRDDITSAIKTKIVPRARFQAFLAASDSTLTETSPLTPSAPVTVQGDIAQPSTPTEAQQIEQQLPPGDVPAKIGEQPATIPRFGEPGSFTRGISDVISGLGEFALNKPEEVALSLYPPTAAAIALRYGPEMGKQWLEDVYHGIQGDKEAAGRATALLAAVGGPLGIKRGVEAIKAAEADTVYQSQYAGLVDQLARENLRIKETPGLVTKPEPTVLEQVAPETSKAIENQPKILTPALSEQDVQRLFLEPEAKRVEQELAAAEKPPKPETQAPVAPQVEPSQKTITLYRATSPTENFGTVFDAAKLKQFEHPEVPGEFWTSDPKYADYFRESFGKDATIETKEVPIEEAEKYRVSPNEFKLPKIETPQVEPQAVEPASAEAIARSFTSALDPKDPLIKKAVDTFASKGLGGFTGKVRETAGLPKWSEMTPQQRFDEFAAYAKEDFKELASIPKAEQEEYMLGRALDPLDPMSGVYKVLLKRQGYKVEGNRIAPPKIEQKIITETTTRTPKVEPAATPAPALTEGGATEVSGETAKSAETPKSPKRKGIERPWDIIDELLSTVGTIRRKSAAKPGTEGYYTPEFHALSQSGASRKLFGSTGASPDEALSAAIKSGFLGEDATVADLENLISRANAQRRAISQGQTPEIQADKFQSALVKQGAKKSSQVISVGDLGKQDKFKIQGEEFEVVSIDPDTGEVTVRDGKKFGHQTIPDGADIPVEKGSFVKAPQSEEFLPEEPTETPPVKTPKLGRGETQGDLISSTQREDFALVGERGTDQERLAAEKSKAAQIKKEAEELAKKQQMELPGAEPSVGPGAASPEAEFSPPTIDELIQPHLREGIAQTPEARAAEAPPVQTLLGRVRGLFMSGSTHPTVQAIKGWIGTIAGKTLPKTTLRDRLSGELGGRFIASRAAGAPMADVFVNDVMAGLKVDQAKFDAALKADNLLSIRDAFQAEADKLRANPDKLGEAEVMQGYADGVNTLLGTEKFPFKDETQLQDYFKDPQVAEAVRRHIDNWKATIEPLYRTTQSIDPTVELPTRGKYSSARINLNPVVKGAYEPTQGPIVGSSGNLLGTLRRRNPFANRAMGTGQSYVLNYAETMANSFAKQLEIANKKAFEDQLVRSGNAVIDNIGKHPKLADGADTKAYPLLRRGFVNKSIYIRDTLSKEYEIAANVVLNPYRDSLLVGANKAFAQAALAGLTDATVHIENLGTALFQVPGATGTPLLVDSILSAMGRMDIPVIAARMGLKSAAEVGRTRLMKYLPEAIQSSINKALLKNMTQMAALAQINATRVPHGSRLPGSKQLGMAVLNADKATRMVLDDTFRNLVAQGLVKGTETARREFINQAGNYNLRAQGPWMRFIRQTYISPFATAGRNFATLGVRGITLNPGVEASSIAAAAALRANMLAKWVGTAALVATANYLITGNLMGRKGTPLGAIDTGKDDANGRAKYFNVAAFTGQSRALRTVGARGAIEAARLGLPPSDQAQAAVRDITNVGLQSVAGPGARAAMIAATGFPPAVSVGRASEVVPPGEQQWVANVKEAAWEANPILASIHEATKPGGNMAKAIERQIPRFTLTTGKPQAMVENYPKVVAMAQANEFTEWVIHTARSLPKEERYKFVGEQINRLEPQLRQHAYREVLRRKVYSRP